MKITEIIENKNFNIPEDVPQVITYLREQGICQSDIYNEVISFTRSFDLGDELFAKTVNLYLTNICCEGQNTKIKIGFTALELNFLNCIASEVIRRALASLLCLYKTEYHKSGWIRYNQDAILNDLKMKNGSIFEGIIQECCNFGLEFRVIGSKNPIVCFHLGFASDLSLVPVVKYFSNFDELIESLDGVLYDN